MSPVTEANPQQAASPTNYDLHQAATELSAQIQAQQPDVNTWLANLRNHSLSLLQQTELPTRKHEAWKYTSLYPLQAQRFLDHSRLLSPAPPDENAVTEQAIPDLDAYRLVFVDGQFQAALSDAIAEVSLINLAEINQAHPQAEKLDGWLQQNAAGSAFNQLNNSLLFNGLFIHVAANQQLSKPIYLLQLNSNHSQQGYSQQRVLIELEQSASMTLIDHRSSLGDSNGVANCVMDIRLQANAQLTHVALHLEAETQQVIAATQVEQARDSHYQQHLVAMGTALKRNETCVNLNQAGAYAELQGVFLCKHQQHLDNQLSVNHKAPHCNSEETYRGLADNQGKVTFNGRIHIHPGAQKTLAQLSNKNLLLSNEAEINTKPELEIYADDVKCAHGATVGQLDEAALFYLQSRGINPGAAKAMLSYGFVNALVDALPIAAVHDFAHQSLDEFFSDLDISHQRSMENSSS